MSLLLCNKNVGILALEIYIPQIYISQSKLELYDNVSEGKYTIGLGQDGIGIIQGDLEDINSISLSVVHSLLEKYNINPSEIGRLEVGTETLTDKSKSTKTVLMKLFDSNKNIEGATIINACYGGTAALLNAFAWAESDGWDGRYAIVVAADIAVYEKGPARPTCGVGSVAVLVGRDAPIAFTDPRERMSYTNHVWDFYKPDPSVEYPIVKGFFSQICYYEALEYCYENFLKKIENIQNFNGDSAKIDTQKFSDIENCSDYLVFHSPYNKLVRKSYARLYLIDAKRKYYNCTGRGKNNPVVKNLGPLSKWLSIPLDKTYHDKSLYSLLNALSKNSYEKKVVDSNTTSIAVGNTYTASVFLGLISLVDNVGSRGELKPGKKILVFSYGSGSIATMYRLHIREPSQARFSIPDMISNLNLKARLQSRKEVHPSELDNVLDIRAKMLSLGVPYIPKYRPCNLYPGTYYLLKINEDWSRSYAVKNSNGDFSD